MILKIILFLLLSISTHLQPNNQKPVRCDYGGQKILTRTKALPYSFVYQCTCPFNYYGPQCRSYRGLLCYVANSQVKSYAKKKGPASIQFSMKCYLNKIRNGTEEKKGQKNYYELPLNNQTIEEDFKNQNYNVHENYDIVWANTTEIFDSEGNLIRNSSDQRSDEEILQSYPPHTFTYDSYFYGMPQFKSFLRYKFRVIKFTQSNIELENPKIQYQNFTKDGLIVGNLTAEIQPSWEEFDVTKLELMIQEYYSPQSIYHHAGMNSAKWRLISHNYKQGSVISGDDSKLPSSFWIIIISFGLFVALAGGRAFLKLFQKWRRKKQSQQLEEQITHEQ